MRIILNKKTAITFYTFVALFSVIAFLQTRYDSSVKLKNFYEEDPLAYVIPAKFVKMFSFGFTNTLADFYWISGIQDYARWDRSNNSYIEEFRNIATLDPKFKYPYIFGILTTASKKSPENLEAFESVANIGIKNLPIDWEIPFYLGTSFNLLNRLQKSVYYIGIANDVPNPPREVKESYNSIIKKSANGDKLTDILLRTIYDTTTSTATKKMLQNGTLVSKITDDIQKIVIVYKEKHGVYPKSIDELEWDKLIKTSQYLRNNFIININRNTGEVKVIQKI